MFRTLACVLLLCSQSVANEIEVVDGSVGEGPVLVVANEQYFLLDLVADPPTVKRITRVVRVDGDNPDPGPNPNVPVKSLADVIRENTDLVDEPLIAKALSEGLYASLKERLADGTITWANCLIAIAKATDMAVGQSEKPAAWKTWREKLNAIVDTMQREGKLATKDQQVAFLGSVAEGMSASSANAAIDFDKLIRLIRFIIDLLNTFGIKIGGGENPVQKQGEIRMGEFERVITYLQRKGAAPWELAL